MFLFELLFALLVALVLGGVLFVVLQRRPVGGPLPALMVILFLATWAGGLWLTPVGPPLWGVHVLSFVLVGMLVALLLTAVSPPRQPRTRGEALRQAEARRDALRTLDGFFWVLVAVLLLGIAIRYL